MSSSLENEFSPPEWATKDEVIRAARHYINYWKIEAKHRNEQWLNELEKKAKAMADSTFIEAQRNILQAENARLKAEVERLTKAGDAMAKAIRWLPQSISDHHLDAWNAAKEGKQS